MPALSFSAVEILPSLLNHKKTQTIRPLKIKFHPEYEPPIQPIKDDKGNIIGAKRNISIPDKAFQYVKSRLKVGDITVLYWKQRSKYKQFCQSCGKGVTLTSKLRKRADCPNCKVVAIQMNFENPKPHEIGKAINNDFSKLLGKVKITEVFEIEMIKEYIFLAKDFRLPGNLMDSEDLAKRDGFKSAEDMFKWFDNAYDLSTPKRFAVYRWKWKK